MNPWYDTDNLLTEMMGLNRNTMAIIFVAWFITYQLTDLAVKKHFGGASGFIGLMPLAGTILFFYYIVIPNVRQWLDKTPKGHFEGLYDFYLFNTNVLEVANDPEPLLPYIPNVTKKDTSDERLT